MNKPPYNCYIDHKGYLMPKSAVIKLTQDIIEWLSSDDSVRFLFTDKPNTVKLNGEWLIVGIGHSYTGYIYCHVSANNNEEFEKYYGDGNNPYVKIFDEDYGAFKKYMIWVSKLGPWFTKKNFKSK